MTIHNEVYIIAKAFSQPDYATALAVLKGDLLKDDANFDAKEIPNEVDL